MKVTITLALVLPVIALLLAGCSGAAETRPEKLVPVDANLVVKIRVAELLKDVDLAALYNESPREAEAPQTLNVLLEQFLNDTGVDFRQFSSLVVFGDVSQVDELEYLAVIASGRFEKDKLIAAIERDGETTLAASEHRGRQIYVDVDGEEERGAFSVLGNETLVIGAVAAVRAVIGIQEGDQALASGKVYDTFNALGDPLFRLVMDVSPETLEELEENLGDLSGGTGGLNNLPIALDALQDLDVIGLAIDKNGGLFTAKAQLDFTNDRSAEDIGDALDGFLKLFGSLNPNPEVKGLLDKVKVTTAGPRVTVLFEADGAELKEVMDGLEGSSEERVPERGTDR